MLVSDWIEEGNAKKFIEKEEADWTLTSLLAAAKDVAMGISYLHSYGGITHRHIKPENVFIRKDITNPLLCRARLAGMLFFSFPLFFSFSFFLFLFRSFLFSQF